MRRTGSRTVEPSTWRVYGIALLLAVDFASAEAVRAADQPQAAPLRAVFASERASSEASRLAEWITANNDNGGLPILIVDKTEARVFAFDTEGRLVGAAPALLGLALGDDSPPGIGDRKLAAIAPQERITPAGRFVAALGANLGGKDILWVDYDAAISLHPVITSNPSEHRLERLATPSASDNRISYGCINVPADFFSTTVRPLFETMGGIVYVLPETRSLEAVFFKSARAIRSTGGTEFAQVGPSVRYRK